VGDSYNEEDSQDDGDCLHCAIHPTRTTIVAEIAKSFNYLLSGTRTVFFLQLSTISTYGVLAQQLHIISHNIESL
jgi:hypothetical protein